MPPPKKRDKDPSTSGTMAMNGSAAVNSVSPAEIAKPNGPQQEQELFLQAFEKPTQIYRYLRNRHSTNPTYLNRTLSYMKDRMSRSNKSRNSFKLNEMLPKVLEKTNAFEYINIIFTGLFDTESAAGSWWKAGECVTVEIILYKLTKSKRKDCNTDFQEIEVLNSAVVFRPNTGLSHYSAISLPMKGIVTCHNSSLKLAFRINTSLKYLNTRKKLKREVGLEKGELLNGRRNNYKIFGTELRISEKFQDITHCAIYESLMVEIYSTQCLKPISARKRTWESLHESASNETVDPFEDQLTLKFVLQWSTHKIPASVAATELEKYGLDMDNLKPKHMANVQPLPANDVNFNNNCIGSCPGFERHREKSQVVYNFMYSNNMRQQTEYTDDVVCPWCGVDCIRLYALLKHLKLCHGRFNFMYQPSSSGARIDVTINDAYDGSYAGSPYDLAGPSGSSFARTCGPVRRTSVTNFLVCRPRRQKTGLDEFLVLDEDDLSNQRPYITGHNRLYHHTETCLPVHPKELDIDSEGESDPLWLRQKTIQMIDEFSDVNEGEKELMKLWNLHVMKYGYVGDCQLPLACEMFLDNNGHEIIRKNLYRNFILHMCSLFDYGLVAPETVYKTVQKLQGMLCKYRAGQELMSQQRAAQLKYWLDVGIHKQDEQRLKSPQKTAPVAMPPTPSSANSNATDSDAGSNAMHPPAKRLAVKRASMHPQPNLTAADKLNASGVAAVGPSKAVAKKSASQPDEPSGSIGKRSENGAKRICLTAVGGGGLSTNGKDAARERDPESNNNINGKTATEKQRTAEAKVAPQANKRKYTHREQPPPKRQRNESNTPTTASHNSTTTSAHSASTTPTMTTTTTTRSSLKLDAKSASTSTAGGATNCTASGTSNASSSQPITTLPKRLITRRQSVCVAEALKLISGVPAAAGSKGKHALRSRQSLEKR